VKRAAKVVASEPWAADAADAYLRGGGDAIGAAVAAFFAAAGEDPGVLFGPVSLLVAQVGVGARAFDGRQRQPGQGLKRPRGVVLDASVPNAARVAAPTCVAALFVALRYGPNAAPSRVMSAGINLAKKNGSLRRAALLETIQRLGPSALAEPGVTRPLFHAVGPIEGGQLTEADLRAVSAVDQPATIDRGGVARVPWHEAPASDDPEQRQAWADQVERQQGVCVADARGCFAVLTYDKCRAGISVDELELVLPLNATPVRRGIRRVAPGTFLPAPAPLVVHLSPDGAPVYAELALSSQARNIAPMRVGNAPSELGASLTS
jgi:gamma-glutamyltranspeptidase/glutathione hydrolase